MGEQAIQTSIECPQVHSYTGSKHPTYSVKSTEALDTLVLKVQPFGGSRQPGSFISVGIKELCPGAQSRARWAPFACGYTLNIRHIPDHDTLKQQKTDENLWLRSGVLLKFRQIPLLPPLYQMYWFFQVLYCRATDFLLTLISVSVFFAGISVWCTGWGTDTQRRKLLGIFANKIPKAFDILV